MSRSVDPKGFPYRSTFALSLRTRKGLSMIAKLKGVSMSKAVAQTVEFWLESNGITLKSDVINEPKGEVTANEQKNSA